MRKKLVLSVMGILLILGTVTNVMFTRAEKSSDRTWLASIEALEALAEDEIGAVRVDVELRFIFMIVMEHKLQKMILRDQYLVNKKIAWYRIVSVLLFLSAFSSCSLGEKQNASSKNEIYIADLDSAIQKDWYLYSDVFKSVRVIPLAMDKSVLLGDVNKMQVYKGHYIVLDEEIARGDIFSILKGGLSVR